MAHIRPQGSQEDLALGIQPVLYRAAAYLVVTGVPGSAELLHNVSFCDCDFLFC